MNPAPFRSAACRVLLGLLVPVIALSSLNTKIAGLGWLLLCLLAVVMPLASKAPEGAGLQSAASAWLKGSLLALGLWTVLSLIWQEPCCTLSADLGSGLRLLFAAAATYLLVRGPAQPTLAHRWIPVAIAAACVLAFVMALVLAWFHERELLPSHHIPWAVSISFLVCLLLPWAFDSRETRPRRWMAGLSSVLGMGAVLLSQSRGAYGIVAWALFLALQSRRHRLVGRLGHQAAVAALLLGLATLIASTLPSDPFRLRQAWHETVTAPSTQNYNSSLGARVYLFRLTWKGFAESPWVGLGAAERLHRIREAGNELPPEQRAGLRHVRELGHAHNQYLHNAIDGGLLGLAGLLALQTGLWMAARRIGRLDRMAGLQLWGIGWMHALAGLSNVNLAHNYYAVMLAVCTGLVFLMAHERAGTPLTQGG